MNRESHVEAGHAVSQGAVATFYIFWYTDRNSSAWPRNTRTEPSYWEGHVLCLHALIILSFGYHSGRTRRGSVTVLLMRRHLLSCHPGPEYCPSYPHHH